MKDVHLEPRAAAPQGARTRELLEKRDRFVARGVSSQNPIFVREARGAEVVDLDGNRYLDLYGGIGVINAGHCPPAVVKAIQEQAEKLIHSCFMVSMYDSYVLLAEKIASLAPGPGPKKAMFVNSPMRL